jgi:hypothetical protein
MIRSRGLSSTFRAMPVLRCCLLGERIRTSIGFGRAGNALMLFSRYKRNPFPLWLTLG